MNLLKLSGSLKKPMIMKPQKCYPQKYHKYNRRTSWAHSSTSTTYRTTTPNSFKRSVSAPAKMQQPNFTNPSSQTFDMFYDRLVAAICSDESLCREVFECLKANFLISYTLKEQADRSSCLVIRNKIMIGCVSTFISRGTNPELSIAKVVRMLDSIEKLKPLAVEMRRKG